MAHESNQTDWTDILSERSYTEFPRTRPKYWNHPLIKYLELPDIWKATIGEVIVRDKAYFLFLDFFNPPKNLQGIGHLLQPLEYIISEAAEDALVAKECKPILDMFLEEVRDYISNADKDERAILFANKLDNITKLGLWRFHFHCSQVDRNKIDSALNLSLEYGKVTSVSKLEYLRDGFLDEIYCAIAPELHRYLKRRRSLKVSGLLDSTITDHADIEGDVIYIESLDCEHCLHTAHRIISKWSGVKKKYLKKDLKSSLRQISQDNRDKIDLSQYDRETADIIRKVLSSIRAVYRLLSSFGGYNQRKRSTKPTFETKSTKGKHRLLPPGRYEVVDDDREDSLPATIEEPLNLIHGLSESGSLVGLFRRKYGCRPKIADDFGEGEDDYKTSNTISVPASWLVDPYRNAIKQKVQAESLILAAEPPAWSTSCLMISTIKEYIRAALEEVPDIQLLSLIALHTGLRDTDLRSIRIGMPPIFEQMSYPQQLEEDEYCDLDIELDGKWLGNIYLEPEESCYVYVLSKKQVGYYDVNKSEFTERCETASRIIRVPLPSVIIPPLREWLELLKQKHGSLSPMAPEAPSSYLKLFKNWSKVSKGWGELMMHTGSKCDENVSPSRIRDTFRSLYVGQMNMSDLHVNLISNELPMHYRAQHFYGNFPYILLSQQYVEASDTIVLTLGGEAANVSDVQEPANDTKVNRELRLGSRLVPKQDSLKAYFLELHESFSAAVEQREMSADAWNRMTLFALRLLQLTTGIRPARDALPDWGSISFKLNWIRISDKDNLHFFESRFVPMATLLREWLECLRKLQALYTVGLNVRLDSALNTFGSHGKQPVFVYIDIEKKVARPFVFDDIKKLEEGIALSHPFNFKANAFRHHLMSRMHEAGLDQTVIDSIMGHKHFGREMFGKFSPVNVPKYAKLAVGYLDRVITAPLCIQHPSSNGLH